MTGIAPNIFYIHTSLFGINLWLSTQPEVISLFIILLSNYLDFVLHFVFIMFTITYVCMLSTP